MPMSSPPSALKTGRINLKSNSLTLIDSICPYFLKCKWSDIKQEQGSNQFQFLVTRPKGILRRLRDVVMKTRVIKKFANWYWFVGSFVEVKGAKMWTLPGQIHSEKIEVLNSLLRQNRFSGKNSNFSDYVILTVRFTYAYPSIINKFTTPCVERQLRVNDPKRSRHFLKSQEPKIFMTSQSRKPISISSRFHILRNSSYVCRIPTSNRFTAVFLNFNIHSSTVN